MPLAAMMPTTSPLPHGARILAAGFPRLATAAVCLSLLAFPAIKAHAAAGTTTSLSVYPSSSVVVGTTVEVEAVVQSGGTNLPFGVVQFCDASAPACIGTALLGQAELTNAPVAGTAAVWLRLGIGTHKIKAVFLPQTNYAGSKSAISTLTVTGNRKTTTTLASTGTAGNYNLTATVSSASRIAPTGPVAFKDATSSNFQLGTADLAAPTPTHYALSSLPLQFVGLGPSTEAVADFNLDGIPDVAVVNATSGSVQILYGDGHGSSNYSYQISVPSATGITVGDFNGDGIPDMAVTASSVNEVYILQVAADKSFGIVASQAVAEFPNGIAAGDFNGDGTLDLVVSHGDGRDGTGISFLAGTGFGTLDPPSFLPVSESLSSIAVADFNGDGKLDFAVGGYGLVRIFLGNGDSTFTQSQALYAGVVPDSIAVADFNGDGHADLAAISPLGKLLTVFLNDGTGTLFQEGTYTTGPYTGFANLTIGDFDGNGHDDIAYVTSVSAFEMGGTHSTIGILKGKGDGTFTAIAGAATGADPLGLAAADWNGDGLVDLVVANSSDGDVQLFKSAVTTSATAAVRPGLGPGRWNPPGLRQLCRQRRARIQHVFQPRVARQSDRDGDHIDCLPGVPGVFRAGTAIYRSRQLDHQLEPYRDWQRPIPERSYGSGNGLDRQRSGSLFNQQSSGRNRFHQSRLLWGH